MLARIRPTRSSLLIGLVCALAATLDIAVVVARPQAPPTAQSPRAGGAAVAQVRAAAAAAADTTAVAATINQYCVTCHNARLKTGGLVLDAAALADVTAGAETWEKVIRKLRGNAMPPAGAPHPGQAAIDALASSLETRLDAAAAARPRPGKLALVHRLSRTEYQNAIRDLLALDALPKEVDIDFLLPADNISSGFDNIADLLFVSPATMERYLDAARKISRLAVGDPAMPVLVNIHKLDPEHPQDERVDELPFGTRGGLAVRSDFPVDGTYVVKVDLAGAPREPQQVEVTIDGARVGLETIGEAAAGGGRRAAPAKPLEFSLPLTAGPKLVGVAFIQRSEARDEATLRPRMRSRGTQVAIASVTISGPFDVKAPGDSPSRRRIFSCRPSPAASETRCATEILSALVRRGYRHPAADADIQDLMPFYEAGRAEGGFERGIQKALERLLSSPQFLFRIERQPAAAAAGAPYRISDLELASRLSFFLWSSIPDDQLLDSAIAGKLHEPRMLDAQVRRMLADPRSESMVTNFAAQWLFLRDIAAKQPDEILFPEFDETLRAAMRRETELFLDGVLRKNRSVLEILTADYTFLNERLARHYGVPNVRGSYFRRVTFPPGSVRGGLLGQGSMLTITSYATRTSPVLRGKWVLENLLSSAPPPPPPNIPALKTEGAESGKALTMREAMTLHRANPACAACHARMDPIGFAMENLDAVGKWRETDGGNPIDSTGVFPDGTRFEGLAGLKQELLRHREQFVGTMAEKLLMYSIGRNLQYYDAPSVRAIVRAAASGNYTLPSLVIGVVGTDQFQMREVQ